MTLLAHSRFAGLVLAILLHAVTLSTPAAAEEGTEAFVPRPDSPLLTRIQTGGLLVFGVSYGIALGVPAVNGFSEGREWFAVPVAGPVIGLSRGAPIDPWAVAFDEIGQVGGLTLLLAGDSVGWGSSASIGRCRSGGVCVGAHGFF